jgi:hypothetical protein
VGLSRFSQLRGQHINSHFNVMNARGVGQRSGDVYVIPSSGAAVENFVPNGEFVTGTVSINLLIRQGSGSASGAQQVGFLTVHYILDDGTVKVETVQFHSECH